ncbi:MAG: folylpolyglutamate synthase/dihydrofolate synthase family protein [Cyanobacteriota bacterium]
MNTITEFESYDSLINYLNNSSMFAIKLGLARINNFLEHIGSPQNNIHAIHIAGTNGKGSVLKYIETILMDAGYNVASFTSPHLVDYTERITINNTKISKKDFTNYSNKIFQLLNRHKLESLTLFEFLTVLAFMYFNDNNIDIMLLETGLGGKYDATNVIIKPLLSIITSIDLDHTELLGNTIDDISKEKAGIIKAGSVTIADKNNIGYNIIEKQSIQNNSKFIPSNSNNFRVFSNANTLSQFISENNGPLLIKLPLIGSHQKENAVLAIKAAEVLKQLNYKISTHNIVNGIENTKWSSRSEFIPGQNILLDGAHNPSAAQALKITLDTFFSKYNKCFIFGTLKNKNSEQMIKNLFNSGDNVIFTEPDTNNPTPKKALEDLANKLNLNINIKTADNLTNALNLAQNLKKTNSLIIITGSLYLTGEFLKLKSKERAI